MPPAFNLSQDQTLHSNPVLNSFEIHQGSTSISFPIKAALAYFYMSTAYIPLTRLTIVIAVYTTTTIVRRLKQQHPHLSIALFLKNRHLINSLEILGKTSHRLKHTNPSNPAKRRRIGIIGTPTILRNPFLTTILKFFKEKIRFYVKSKSKI